MIGAMWFIASGVFCVAWALHRIADAMNDKKEGK